MCYCCICCNYKTNRQYDFKKHLNTKKHIKYNIEYSSKNVSSFNLNLPHSTSFYLNLPHSNKLNVNKDNNIIIKCKYCNKDISDKNKKRHYINACLNIPDKLKNRLIEKHNSNPRTINKINLINTSNNNFNITNNINNINNNNINNNLNNNLNSNLHNININPIGQECFDHITPKKMEYIIKANTNLMKIFYESLQENKDNMNTYIDNRNSIAFFADSDKNIRIERLKKFLNRFCELCMNRIKDYINSHPDDYTDISKKIFTDTYNIFICMINSNNIHNSDKIEAEHKALVSCYEDDVKLCIMKYNKISKARLNTLEKDFNKLS